MRKLGLFAVLVLVGLGGVACDEENPLKPEVFGVTIQVKNPAGDPVEGLRVGLVNDHRYFMDNKDASRAGVAIQLTVVTNANARISVEDIEGRNIRTLIDDRLVAGQHQVVWNGNDDEGIHQPSGRYTVHLVITELGTGQLLFEDRQDMLMSMLDSSRVPAGYTDAGGKLVLRDKKLFPHLYNRPDMDARDETAEIIGTLTLTPTMRISLADTLAGGSMWFERDVLAGAVVDLIWDPAPKAAETTPATWSRVGTKDFPPVDFELGPIYPNPFN